MQRSTAELRCRSEHALSSSTVIQWVARIAGSREQGSPILIQRMLSGSGEACMVRLVSGHFCRRACLSFGEIWPITGGSGLTGGGIYITFEMNLYFI